MTSTDLSRHLSSFLPTDQVSTAEDVLDAHASDKWHASALPDVVVFAHTTEDVAKTVAFAHQHGIPVYTRAAGTGHIAGCVPVHGGILISTEPMNEILEISPSDGTAVVQPGVITGELQQAVREHGWYYPPDPASLKECTLGGNVATNAGGPRCLKYGVTKQYILGLTVVLADGQVLKTGGRCHKNSTGFDLTSLMVGSEGMLGIITEITVRLIPHPQTRAMLGASFPDFAAAAAAVQAILDAGTLPSALEITDGFTMNAARDYLGADKLPPGDAYLMIEIDGNTETVARELPTLRDFLLEHQALRIDEAPNEDACERIWQLRRDFSYSLKHTGLTKLNEDIVVPRSKLVALVEFAEQLQQDTGIPVACFGHAGDGNIHTNIMVADYDDPEIKAKADAALDRLFTWVIENDGVISGEHGIGLAKKPWITQALGETSMEVHRQIKQTLDPKNILNPGKFLD
ncbi:FAD-binding protein [Verrucomicrobiaceae bacterium N1E253]|uniref:FAD-binding protein n=1 Tax=Oceaniferula marina TaxID=2748318 RepID=A0A851GF13_9BACT|nr:FAD-linked oxidase C-terminal domain-containing protein [Oceaniferula marina]NWK55779.1 FAD-binding protein [Oceaniferula marina]